MQKTMAMTEPLISICIPAYKHVDFLKRLLDSIRIQTYTHYEVILSDDSPDGSVKMLVENYTDLPIQYYQNTPSAGMPQNWNLAIEKASGNWIKIMHDDDWFTDENSLKRFVRAAGEHPQCSFVFSACNKMHLKDGTIEKHELTAKRGELLLQSACNLIYDNVIGHPSAVMHRKNKVRYDAAFRWMVDIDFYIRFLQTEVNWHYIPEPCINIGIDTEQLSSQYYKNPKVEIPEYFMLANKFALSLRNQYVFHAFWLLVRKFKIKSFEQIRSAGYKGPIPDALHHIIKYQQKIPQLIIKQTPFSTVLMKRCLRKMLQSS